MRYHRRQVTFIVSALLFTGLGFLITQGNFGRGDVYKNSPYVIVNVVSFLSLLSIFVCTLFCANVVLRDKLHGMEQLLFTTSVTRSLYFGVRLTGLLLAVFGVLCFAVAGAFLGALLATPVHLRGPFQASYYLHPLFVFGLPNVLFVCSILFSVAMLTKSMKAVYASGVGLFVLYFTASILGNSPMMASSVYKVNGTDLLPALSDPFGIAAFFGETRLWPASLRNEQLFPVQGVFLANRLLWSSVSFLLLLISFRSFRFRLPSTAHQKRMGLPVEIIPVVPYQPVAAMPHGVGHLYRTIVSQWKLELIAVFKHIPFLVMLALWIFLNAVDLKENLLHGPYGVRYYLASGFIAEELISMKPALLLLIFYAAEMIGRERSSRMDALIFSTPVPNGALWGGKSLALAVLIVTLVTANIITGIGLQVFTGFPVIEWGTYVSLYYFSGVPLLLFALLIVFIQTLVPNKYLGMLLSMVIVGLILFSRQLGLTHYLLRYAMVPGLLYSSFNEFGHYARGFPGYMLYWFGLAAILSLLAIAMWPRSTYVSWWQRVSSIGEIGGKAGKLCLAAFVLVWIGTGWWIYQQTPVTSTARNNTLAREWYVQYEKQFKSLAPLPQPIIIAVKTIIDIYPAEGRYKVSGSYLLQNQTDAPIEKLWLGVDPEVSSIQWAIPGATLQKTDSLFKQYWYVLRSPLAPGDTMRLPFTLEVIRSRYASFNRENSVVSNGSYIELEKFLPYFGYNDRFETGDVEDRKAYGLPPLVFTASTDSSYHLVEYETIVSTAHDQQAVTVGRLLRSWSNGDRQCFHYKTEQPVAFMFAVSSARYMLQQEIYKGVAFSIYHHPGHLYNVPMMMQAMKDAVDYGNAHFSRYPLDHLTLAEIPHYPGSATAYPGVVFSTERLNFMTDFRDSTLFNTVYATTAHEVAHQWWANALMPLDAPGRAVLTESLAKYTEAMVSEKRFGQSYLSDYLKYDNTLYFNMRNGDGMDELPLWQTAGQTFVHYQKGGLALYAIKEALGEEKVNTALHQLIEKHAASYHKATTTTLFNALAIGANTRELALLDQLFKKVVVYNNEVKVMDCQQQANGKFRVSLQVNISKTNQTQQPAVFEMPDEDITVAVYNQPANKRGRYSNPIYWQVHHFTKKESVITVITDSKPVAVAIDPCYYFLDDNLSDNVAVLK